MKRSKKIIKLISLACVLVVACCATVGVIKHEEKKEQIQNSDKVILQIPSDTVTALSWDNGTSELSFHKDDVWLYDEDPAFPVNEEKVTELLSLFENFGVSFEIDDVEDYGLYGLDHPVCTIQITTTEQLADLKTAEEIEEAEEQRSEKETNASDDTATEEPSAASEEPDATETASKPAGNTYELRLGNFSKMDSKRYVSIGDGKVYLVSDDPLDLFHARLSDMIDHDDDLSYTSVSEIRFTGKEAYSIVYREDSPDAICSEDVYFTQRDGKTVPLDTERVGNYLNHLTTLNPLNYVNYNATEEDLIDYGLDAPELTVSVDYQTLEEDETSKSDTFVIHISRNRAEVDAAKEAAQKAEDDEEYVPEAVPAYIRIGDSQIIYEITDDQYQALMEASYNDLRHQEVFAADFDSVTEIRITLENSIYTLSYAPDEADADHMVWLFKEHDIDITDLQEALEHLQAYEFTDETAAGQEEISLTVQLDHPNHPEIEMILYRYDGDHCLAKVNGEIFALVDRSDVVDLVEAVHAIVLNE